MSRLGQRFLAIGGLCLVALMVYTVVLDFEFKGSGETDGGAGTPVIAVFYPERVYWREFREGIHVCARKKLLKIVDETDLTVLVESSKSNRRLGFEWHGVRGVVAMNVEVETLLKKSPQPPAIVGSSNTVITEAIAKTLNEAAEPGGETGPLLLIPWASAVLTERSEPGETPVGLLDIHPGRTFRFCPNNQAQAGLLVGCMLHREAPLSVDKVIIIEDRQDPYSIDLADSFHRAIERAAPGVEIDERSLGVGLSIESLTGNSSGPTEDLLAASIWNEVEKLPEKRSLWVVLPIQEDPTKRMIDSLSRQAHRATREDFDALQVLTGDSIGLDVLESHAGRCPFPISSVSNNSPTALADDLNREFSVDSQIPAEIVSSLIFALDQLGEKPLTSTALRKQLDAIQWKADNPRAIGRPLRFSRSGERIYDDLGHVLTIRPHDSRVLAIPRLAKERWGPAVAVESPRLSIQP